MLNENFLRRVTIVMSENMLRNSYHPTYRLLEYRKNIGEGGENIAPTCRWLRVGHAREYDSQIHWRSHAMKFDPLPLLARPIQNIWALHFWVNLGQNWMCARKAERLWSNPPLLWDSNEFAESEKQERGKKRKCGSAICSPYGMSTHFLFFLRFFGLHLPKGFFC